MKGNQPLVLYVADARSLSSMDSSEIVGGA